MNDFGCHDTLRYLARIAIARWYFGLLDSVSCRDGDRQLCTVKLQRERRVSTLALVKMIYGSVQLA